MDTRLWNEVGRRIDRGQAESAEEYLERRLAREKPREFKGLIGAGFSNSPEKILDAINKFMTANKKRFPLKAVYLEMNGFDINFDRWYYDSFGYKVYGKDPADLDWLCDWQSPRWGEVNLTGLEPVQKDFEWYHTEKIYEDDAYKALYTTALLLVMVKFVRLIQKSLAGGPRAARIPVLATAHEFDIVARFLP